MNETQKTIDDSIAHELKGLVKPYDFSEAVTVSLLSESENKAYLVTDSTRLEK